MKRHISVLWGFGLMLAVATASADASLFRVDELQFPGASTSAVNGINVRGQTVGTARTDDGISHAVLWSGTAALDMGNWNGSSVTPMAINDTGEVVGFASMASDREHALVWRGAGWVDLGRGYAQGINLAGQVVGYGQHATMWSAGATIDLGNAVAYGINDTGNIVGFRYGTGGNPIAVTWAGGVGTDLERDSAAYSINGAGNIVGESRTPTGEYQAALWTAQEKSWLGSIESGQHTLAVDINDTGQVVGQSNTGALLWTGDEQVDLNAVLANPAGGQFRLRLATGINNGGQIAAVGTDANNYIKAYLLTPIPEPASLALVLGGLCMLWFGRWPGARS